MTVQHCRSLFWFHNEFENQMLQYSSASPPVLHSAFQGDFIHSHLDQVGALATATGCQRCNAAHTKGEVITIWPTAQCETYFLTGMSCWTKKSCLQHVCRHPIYCFPAGVSRRIPKLLVTHAQRRDSSRQKKYVELPRRVRCHFGAATLADHWLGVLKPFHT